MYEKDKIPKILKNKDGILTFEDMMERCYDKFNKNSNLKRLLDNANGNAQNDPAAQGDGIKKE